MDKEISWIDFSLLNRKVVKAMYPTASFSEVTMILAKLWIELHKPQTYTSK